MRRNDIGFVLRSQAKSVKIIFLGQRIMRFAERLASSDDIGVKNLIGVSITDSERMYDFEAHFANLMRPDSRVLYDA